MKSAEHPLVRKKISQLNFSFKERFKLLQIWFPIFFCLPTRKKVGSESVSEKIPEKSDKENIISDPENCMEEKETAGNLRKYLGYYKSF